MKGVLEGRRAVEREFQGIVSALRREFRWAPRGKVLLLPLVAAAVGVALGLAFWRRR